MASFRLKYVHADRDRHGNVRYYYFRRGQPGKIRLPGRPGTDEFMAAYAAIEAGRPVPQPAGPVLIRAERDSLEWLCNSFYQSAEFKQQAEGTRYSKRRIFRLVCNEPVSPQSSMRLGELPFAQITTKALRTVRDRKMATPQGANNWIKALRALYKWAVETDLCDHNPARDVPLLKVVSEGFHTWTIEEMRQFEAAHPIGSQARLAMALLAYTGQRKSDVMRLGPQHVQGGRFRITQKKNETRKPVTIEIPLLPELAAVITATPCGHLTFLVNENGAAWSAGGFGNKFREWCIEAGLPHCSSHGLRKAAACAAAEGGATVDQLMAIFGWATPEMALLYTRKANKRKMADATMHLLGKRGLVEMDEFLRREDSAGPLGNKGRGRG